MHGCMWGMFIIHVSILVNVQLQVHVQCVHVCDENYCLGEWLRYTVVIQDEVKLSAVLHVA